MEISTGVEQTLFADLQQRCMDALFDAEFPENGSFSLLRKGDRSYWYYQTYEPASARDKARRSSKYVGPADDPVIQARVETFRRGKGGYRERRALVRALTSLGLVSPPRLAGDLIESMWKSGLFRLRGVLVGTAAYQTYPGLLGLRFPAGALMTFDLDFAQFHSIAISVEDEMAPVLETLKAIDPSFGGVPHASDQRMSTAYVNREGFRVEFLTPNVSKDDYQSRPALMPTLGGAAAQPLRFLDFLIHEPVWSVVLHRAGVPVLVPAPERYAIHKLIVAIERRQDGRTTSKAGKDIVQAETLIVGLAETGRGLDLGSAWAEAWERGPAWREDLDAGRGRLSSAAREALRLAVAAFALGERRSLDQLW